MLSQKSTASLCVEHDPSEAGRRALLDGNVSRIVHDSRVLGSKSLRKCSLWKRSLLHPVKVNSHKLLRAATLDTLL